jgi:hypothetical protein
MSQGAVAPRVRAPERDGPLPCATAAARNAPRGSR